MTNDYMTSDLSGMQFGGSYHPQRFDVSLKGRTPTQRKVAKKQGVKGQRRQRVGPPIMDNDSDPDLLSYAPLTVEERLVLEAYHQKSVRWLAPSEPQIPTGAELESLVLHTAQELNLDPEIAEIALSQGLTPESIAAIVDQVRSSTQGVSY